MAIQINTNEQYFPTMLFIMLYKMVSIFVSMDV